MKDSLQKQACKPIPSGFKLSSKPLSSLTIISESGIRQLSGEPAPRIHAGIDLRAAIGTNVSAAHDGTVIKTSWTNGGSDKEDKIGYGRVVVIRDEATNMLTLYAHLSQFLVKKDDEVKAGNLIAKSGNSGKRDAHLHFEVRDGNYKIGNQLLWQVIKQSGDHSLGATNEGYLNPRPLLGDLALNLAKQELGLQNIADADLTDAQKAQIEIRSCSIFSCDVIAQPASISLESDRRNNTFSKVSGNSKDLEFCFPDFVETKIGFDTIDTYDKTKDNKLILDGQEVKFDKILCLKDDDGRVVHNMWGVQHNNKWYALVAAEEREFRGWQQTIVSGFGQDLLIIPNFDYDYKIDSYGYQLLTADNAIKIKDFDFKNKGFGIGLEDLRGEVLVEGLGGAETILLANGNFVVVWSEVAGDASYYNVFAQIFDQNGNEVRGKFEIASACFECENRYNVKIPFLVKSLTNGNFIVLHMDYSVMSSDSRYPAFAQIFDQNGNKIENEFQIPYLENFESMNLLADGNFIFTVGNYYSEFLGYYDCSSLFFLQSSKTSLCCNFDLGWLSFMNGKIVITSPGYLLYVSVVDQIEILIDQNDQPYCNPTFIVHDKFIGNGYLPSITSLTNGNFVITWQNEYQFAQTFDQNGNKIGDEFHINNAVQSKVISLTNGNFAVAWKTHNNYYDNDIFAQIFDQSGNRIGNEFQVNSCYKKSIFYGISFSATHLANGNFVVVWPGKFKIIDINHLPLTPYLQISSNPSPQAITLQPDITHISSSNDDTFILPVITPGSTDNIISYQISNFRMAGNDIIDLSNFATDVKKASAKQANNLQLSIFSRNIDTVITINGTNTEVVLLNYDITQFKPEYVVGANIIIESIAIQNPNQSPTYTQLDATINLQDIRINATNPQAIIEASLTLLDSEGNVISDPNDLLIQIGETDLGTISTFNNGTWQANGTVTEVNDLLSNLTLELGQSFEESFNIDVDITYNGNQILHTTSEIFVDYQCQSLTPEIQELIDSQTTNEGREIILDLARYFYDPNNPDDIARLVFNIQQRIAESDLKQDSCLDIQRLNQTAFAIISNCQGIYNLTAIAQNQCQDQEYQDFDFIVDNSPSSSALPIFSTTSSVSRTNAVSNTRSVLVSSSALPNFSTENSPSVTNSAPNQDQASANNDALLIGLITAGGSLLLIAALCYLYKKSSAIKEYFNHHTQNNNIEGTQIQLPTIGECLDYHNRNTQMQPRSNVRPVSANVHQGSTQTHSQVPL